MKYSIFASKMYKACKDPEKIHAAISNPVNTELVQQLSKYVTFVEKEEEVPEADVSSESEVIDPEVEASDVNAEAEEATSDTDSEAPSDSEIDEVEIPQEESEVEHGSEESSESETSEETTDAKEPDDEKPVEEATAVLSATASFVGNSVYIQDLPDAVNVIRGELNARADTAGVNRALIKDNELWVYYKDDINLNKVMGPVIELLNAANYRYLEFNRLARSDNAIVFEINIDDSKDQTPADYSNEGDEK